MFFTKFARLVSQGLSFLPSGSPASTSLFAELPAFPRTFFFQFKSFILISGKLRIDRVRLFRQRIDLKKHGNFFAT